MYSLYFATRHLQNFRRQSHDAFHPITKRHSTKQKKNKKQNPPKYWLISNQIFMHFLL